MSFKGRGSSNVVASLIAAFLTLLGGLIAYNAALTLLMRQGTHAILMVDAKAALSPDGVILTVSIKNICRMEVLSATLELDGNVVAAAGAIPPGASRSFVVKNPPGVWVPGTSRACLLKATFADKSTSAIIFSVPAIGSLKFSGQTGHSGPNDQSDQANPGRRILFFDSFDAGFSGWFLWGNPEGYTIEVSNHGKPAPSLHVFGNGPRGVAAGAAKNVELPADITVLLVQLGFDYNTHAPPERGNFPGNLWLRIDGDGKMLFNAQIFGGKSADSGWKDVELCVVLPHPSPEILTLIIYTVDESDRLQEFWIDNVYLEI
jgi:hypothetical protein